MKRMLILSAMMFAWGTSLLAQSNTALYVQNFRSDDTPAKIYRLELKENIQDFSVLITQDGNPDKTPIYTQMDNFDVFVAQFKNRLLVLGGAFNDPNIYPSRFFYELNAAIKIQSTTIQKPSAGVIRVAESVQVVSGNKKGPIDFNIDQVDMVIKNGFIEDISITGTFVSSVKIKHSEGNGKSTREVELQDKFIQFTNQVPVGFTSKTNLRNLVDHSMIQQTYIVKPASDNLLVNLGHVISYEPSMAVDTKDYSPKDGRVSLKGGEVAILYKEEYNKLFEVVAFSDFLGIQEGSPNGLVQFDFRKQIPINTSRMQVCGTSNVGFLNKIELNFLLSKIEQNNQRLEVSKFNEINYVNTLDVLNRKVYSFGIDPDLVTFDLPALKMKFDLLVGFRYGRVLLSDSLAQDINNQSYGANTTAVIPRLRMNVISESRFGFMAEIGRTYLKVQSDLINQVDNEDNFLGGTDGRIDAVNFVMFQAKYNNGADTGNLFLRYQMNSRVGMGEQNFSQLQLGYTFDILGKAK